MKILVPLDFSENSIKALELAISLNGKDKGKIILVHCIDVIYDFAAQAAVAVDGLYRDSEETMSRTVKKYEQPGITFETMIREGRTSWTVAREAEDQKADLIVMGTQGKTGLEKNLLGSTAINLIKDSTVPVLVVPADADTSQINRMVLALEIANHEEKFLSRVKNLSEYLQLKLEFLHIETAGDFKEKISVMGLEKYLATQFPDLKTTVHQVAKESAIQGMEAFMEDNRNLILVMCHHNKTIWEQIFTKSKSIEMVSHSKVPLLIFT